MARERADDVEGVVVLEAPYFGDIEAVEETEYIFTDEPYPLPVLHFYSDALWGQMDAITTYARNQEYIDHPGNQFTNIHIAGSGHIGLTDLSLISPFITNVFDGRMNTRDAELRLLEINDATLDFLSEQVSQQDRRS